MSPPASRVSRRTLLMTMTSGSLVFATGCLGDVSPSRSVGGTSTQPTETDTAAETTPSHQPTQSTTTADEWRRCDQPTTPTPPKMTTITTSDRVAPKSYPEPPERLAREPVVTFVKATERAYKTNEILRTEGSRFATLTYVDITGLSVADVNRVDGGFVVHVIVDFGYGKHRGDGTTTASSVHADGSAKVSYFVANHIVRRVEADRYEFVNPTEAHDGVVLWCTPDSTDSA
ncbi:hypothetical protein [Haladaptatus sp. NG-SE-30]